MTPGDAYWVGAPGRGNPHSASVVVNTCHLTVVSPDASSDSSSESRSPESSSE